MPEKIFEEVRARQDAQRKGLEMALRIAFDEYKQKTGELPELGEETNVDAFIRSRPDLWRAIQKLDLVLGDVKKTAIKILEEMREE